MKNGNWVPISKNFISDLPKDRAYTKLEAAYCLQVDYDNKNKVTIAGYSALWSWSRTRINSFLNQLGIQVEYLENVKKKQNQKGQIKRQIKDRSETDQRQIRFIENKELQPEKDRSKTDKRQIKNRSKDTTIYPIKNLDPKPINIYPDKSRNNTEFDRIKNLTISYINFIADTFKNKAPKKTESLEKNSYETIEQLIRLDGFELKYIENVLEWSKTDDFWKEQVLSLSRLRGKSNNGSSKFQNLAISYDKQCGDNNFSFDFNNLKM